MNEKKLRLYQAWVRHYTRNLTVLPTPRADVAAAMEEAMDDMPIEDIYAIMDEAARDTAAMRERAYRRSIRRSSLERA
jgi:hypothetical protein